MGDVSRDFGGQVEYASDANKKKNNPIQRNSLLWLTESAYTIQDKELHLGFEKVYFSKYLNSHLCARSIS